MSHFCSARAPALIAAVVISCAINTALADPERVPAPDVHPWTLRAGGEYGRDSSRGSLASIDYTPNPETETAFSVAPWFGVSGLHTDAPSTSGGTISTGGRAYLEWGSQAIHGGAAFDTTTDQTLRRSNRWTALVDLAIRHWAVGLNIATRTTHFESFEASLADATRPSITSQTAVTASCSLHDVGYGASVTYASEQWTATLAGSGNHYDAVKCGFDVSVPSRQQRLDRNGFQQLAGAFLARAMSRAGGQIGSDTRLLQSTAGASLAHHWTGFSIALDYEHSNDEFDSATQDSFSLTGSIMTWQRLTLDLVVGTTVSSSVGTPFGGLYASVSL